jgi:2-dehydro-3-deoxyphosphogluconate aldolase/(4S)-4-hydroxy-2-oxoglutarate aldolase
VTPANTADWFAVPSVVCVGGSWIVPSGAPDAAAIRATAAEAAALGRR